MAILGHIGAQLDLLIRQGASYGPYEFQLKNPDGTPIDLTGVVLRGHLRKTAQTSDLVTPFDVEIIGPPTEGRFLLSLTWQVTAELPCGAKLTDKESQYQWDFEMMDSIGRVLPLYFGDVKVFREVTR